jgi:hypothetical protein
MNNEFIKCVLLDDPFTEKGPILIGNKAFSSDGLKVQFLPDNEASWVANLTTDRNHFNVVHYLREPNVLIIAGGHAYIIDTAEKKVIAEPGFGHYTELVAGPDGTVVIANFVKLTVITPEASVWHSRQISFDGIKDLKLEGDILSGLCFDPRTANGSWEPFSFNMKTKEISGGSYGG